MVAALAFGTLCSSQRACSGCGDGVLPLVDLVETGSGEGFRRAARGRRRVACTAEPTKGCCREATLDEPAARHRGGSGLRTVSCALCVCQVRRCAARCAPWASPAALGEPYGAGRDGASRRVHLPGASTLEGAPALGNDVTSSCSHSARPLVARPLRCRRGPGALQNSLALVLPSSIPRRPHRPREHELASRRGPRTGLRSGQAGSRTVQPLSPRPSLVTKTRSGAPCAARTTHPPQQRVPTFEARERPLGEFLRPERAPQRELPRAAAQERAQRVLDA